MTPASRTRALVVGGAVALALVASLVVGRVHEPPGIFPKYAAIASSPVDAGRAQDVSPLYLALTRLTLSHGPRAMLLAQCVAHAATAGLIAFAALLLAGTRAGIVAGVLTATHAPLLVAAGTHEPEAWLQLALAAAMLAGLLARRSTPGARAEIAWSLLAGAALAAAAMLRPQHLVLVPAWCGWLGLVGGRRRWASALGCLVGAGVALAPVMAPRLASGVPTTMNPAVVAYEGNWPGASGLARVAPPLVKELEREHPESLDYGHVAYRRLASFALGRPADALEANAWWGARLAEGARAFPAQFVRRLGSKLLHALGPHEIHDLRTMEDLSRRVRAIFPWGFLLPAMALAWIPLMRRERFNDLAGPLAVAALALAIQVVFYASARQRLPLATALLVVMPVLLDDALRGQLRVRARAALVLGLGIVTALLLAWATGRSALIDDAQWDVAQARPASSAGEILAELADGRRLRTRDERDEVLAVVVGAEAIAQGRRAPAELDDLALRGIDDTRDDLSVLQPDFLLAPAATNALDHHALLDAALALRPGDPRVAARAFALHGVRDVESALRMRPAGTDPASWLWLLSRETGDPRLAEPLRAHFPELFD